MHEILTPIFGGLAATLGYLLWHARREIGTLREAACVAEARVELAENSEAELRSQLERWQARAVETSATIETLTREATELRKGAIPERSVDAFYSSLRALAEREAK